tara:strand:+ start:1839 stop:3404 length:1566 start_codon:yes stop_codon:yes gene_type:complete
MNQKTRGKILWIDDEIDLLKPHVLYLEEKGYFVEQVTNGRDGIIKVGEENFDLVLLDQVMPGIDGMSTLREIKERTPFLPVIMITKNEEEWLMDEAISEKTAGYLTKPVNPSQIFLACKKVLEEDLIIEKKTAGNYLEEFQKIEELLISASETNDWWNLYLKLVNWQIELESQKELGLNETLNEQLRSANRGFVKYISKNYKKWINGERKDRPPLSIDLISDYILPLINTNENILFIVIDCLRLDQSLSLIPFFQEKFKVKIDYHVSILPTATPFARNAIFSGRFLGDIQKNDEDLWAKIIADESTMNSEEDQIFGALLKRIAEKDISYIYHKINVAKEGKRFLSHMKEYKDVSIISLVVNFVDLLTHHRSESDLLQEVIPDEAGYRKLVQTWFSNSWLYEVLNTAARMDMKVVITTDHGSIRVKNGVKVAADRTTSAGVRYKYGSSLICSEKNALVIKRPFEYKLPEIVKGTNYLIAKDENFFVYPTQYHKYLGQLQDSFQHGGISLEEMLVPIITLENR